MPRAICFTCLAMLCLAPLTHAQQPVSLMKPTDAWKFNHGGEFPGATGGLTVDAEAKDSLKLVGDFTKGGLYVQAGRKIDDVDIRELALWVRNPDGAKFTVRLGDGSGQTHQIALKLESSADWQRVVLPLERFFTKRGTADAVTNVAKYEYWGGAKDGRWHGPAKGIYFLLSASGAKQVRTLWLHDIAVVPAPTEAVGAEIATVLPLDEIVEGEHDWRFSLGQEFKGAKGTLTVDKDQSCLKLTGDFTGGGAYVAALRDLGGLGVKDVAAIKLRVKSDTGAALRFQMQDGTGQTHQRPRIVIPGDGQWHDLVIRPLELAGGEHWGGANDGKWHGPPKQISISLAGKVNEKIQQPVVYLANIRAEGSLAVFVQPAAFRSDFEAADKMPAGWTSAGDVAIDAKTAFKGSRALVLSRMLDAIETPTHVTGPTFPVAPGKWDLGLACKPDLHSPDNSYSAVVTLECLDAQGKVIERLPLADVFGKKDWLPVTKRVEMPAGVVTARYHVQLNKTHGRFWVDEVSASYLAPLPRRDGRIARLMFATARLGNLLLPDDPRRVDVTVETTKPLRDSQLTLSWELRDYWGAEQTRPAVTTLSRADKKGPRFTYEATLDLGAAPLDVGRYDELHAAIPQPGEEPFRNFTSLAVLPEAETKRHKPEDVPFTSRNWDNRFPQYFELSDRLGLRTCGVWGGWSAKPPYKAEAPAIEMCKRLGMGVLSGTPIATIERGKADYDETALRGGVRNFIEKYGHYRPLTINLGNEPHGKGERVRTNVAAYRAVYEEIKKADPTIFVLATAVEPNEEYFQAGYGKWCDAFDFHVYEGYQHVRKNIEQYQALMKKYDVVKPIWSTELGLNSQGMPRHVVAVELLKTFTTFFAAGGVNASWFGLIYPDPEAKSYGSSGDSHNVFDCRYNRYAPRLDAIAYYHAVNAIGTKKFHAEKEYAEGVHAFLFRGERNLQVLWKTKSRHDTFVPLPGVDKVLVIRSDGSRRTLYAAGKGVTLSITEDPLLLVYDGADAQLAAALTAPAATISGPATASRHTPLPLRVLLSGSPLEQLSLMAPPHWSALQTLAAPQSPGQSTVLYSLTGPSGSSIREVEVILALRDDQGRNTGELYWRMPIAE